MKKHAVRFLTLLLVLCMLPLGATAATIQVTVDGKAIAFTDAHPYADENNRTLVPLRAAGEAMGMTVDYDETAKAAIFSQSWTADNSPIYVDLDEDGVDDVYVSYQEVRFYLDSNSYTYTTVRLSDLAAGSGYSYDLDSWSETMDTKVVAKDNRVYAPIRYLAEAFYWDVAWDSATSTVKIMPYQAYSYYYLWYTYPLDVTIENDESNSVSSATITSVQVSVDGGAFTNVAFTPYTEADFAADKADGYLAIAGVTTDYYCTTGHTYTVKVGLKGLKTNGADFTDEFEIVITD